MKKRDFMEILGKYPDIKNVCWKIKEKNGDEHIGIIEKAKIFDYEKKSYFSVIKKFTKEAEAFKEMYHENIIIRNIKSMEVISFWELIDRCNKYADVMKCFDGNIKAITGSIKGIEGIKKKFGFI